VQQPNGTERRLTEHEAIAPLNCRWKLHGKHGKTPSSAVVG